MWTFSRLTEAISCKGHAHWYNEWTNMHHNLSHAVWKSTRYSKVHSSLHFTWQCLHTLQDFGRTSFLPLRHRRENAYLGNQAIMSLSQEVLDRYIGKIFGAQSQTNVKTYDITNTFWDYQFWYYGHKATSAQYIQSNLSIAATQRTRQMWPL